MRRALLILALGAALGFLNNAFSPKGIPLITPPKKAPLPGEFMPLPKAHELWSTGGAFLLDARNPEDFEAGHIANALSLPVEAFGEHYVKLAPMLAPESDLIVYCDGADCELSHKLAEQLKQQGYTNIHILYNGWTAWREAGYPTEKGPAQ